MGVRWEDGGYSASVELYLLVDDRKLTVAQVSPDSIILREDGHVVPNGHAQLVIIVDGREQVYDIIIHGTGSVASELAYA